MASLNRFSAILFYCDSTHLFASRCRISGDSRPAILGSVRFVICNFVPLRNLALLATRGSYTLTRVSISQKLFRNPCLSHPSRPGISLKPSLGQITLQNEESSVLVYAWFGPIHTPQSEIQVKFLLCVCVCV